MSLLPLSVYKFMYIRSQIVNGLKKKLIALKEIYLGKLLGHMMIDILLL